MIMHMHTSPKFCGNNLCIGKDITMTNWLTEIPSMYFYCLNCYPTFENCSNTHPFLDSS